MPLSPSSSGGSGVSYKPMVNPADLIKKFGSGKTPFVQKPVIRPTGSS